MVRGGDVAIKSRAFLDICPPIHEVGLLADRKDGRHGETGNEHEEGAQRDKAQSTNAEKPQQMSFSKSVVGTLAVAQW